MKNPEEVVPMPWKEEVEKLQLLRELNKALNDPKSMDEALYRVQQAIEKGVIPEPTKPDNA